MNLKDKAYKTLVEKNISEHTPRKTAYFLIANLQPPEIRIYAKQLYDCWAQDCNFVEHFN